VLLVVLAVVVVVVFEGEVDVIVSLLVVILSVVEANFI
jgi:hypothetical protein